MLAEIIKLPIVKAHYSGKVRDVLDLGSNLLIITSDRISAFDVIFPNEIPDKGKILNQIATYFLKNTTHIVDNHFITDDVFQYPEEFHPYLQFLDKRSMMVKKTNVIPFECIARGYISGSAWDEFNQFGTISGTLFTDKMKQSQRFSQVLFTPSTKAVEGHDENISYKKMLERIDPEIAEFLKEKSIELYKWAHELLLEKGIIIADTKFEFGTIGNKIILIDEIFTPDSSRFWDKDEYEIGSNPKSYDKQFVRDFVTNSGWNKQPPAPILPQDVIEKTMQKYKTIYYKLTGDDTFL